MVVQNTYVAAGFTFDLVSWGTLALINAGLAQGKGRPGAWWFLLSLFLGPLATLWIVVLPAIPEAERNPGSGGWRPRPLTRIDWLILGAMALAVIATLVVLALRL
jgi:hypothetical protein